MSKDPSQTSIGRDRHNDLNMTADDIQKMKHGTAATMNNFAHAGIVASSAEGPYGAHRGGGGEAEYRRRKKTKTALDEEEPQQPMMLQTEHNPMFSPDSYEKYDLNTAGSPSPNQIRQSGTRNAMKNVSNTSGSRKLPPRSPNQYTQSQ